MSIIVGLFVAFVAIAAGLLAVEFKHRRWRKECERIESEPAGVEMKVRRFVNFGRNIVAFHMNGIARFRISTTGFTFWRSEWYRPWK